MLLYVIILYLAKESHSSYKYFLNKQQRKVIKVTKTQLKKERKKRAWSQFTLEANSGVSRYNISLLENGHRKMSKEMAAKFEAAFAGKKITTTKKKTVKAAAPNLPKRNKTILRKASKTV